MQLKLNNFLRGFMAQSLQRRHASSVSGLSCAELPQRSIIRVSGPDSADLLQGLMTNDIERIVSEKWRSLYCMFLDIKGRVLFDAMVYPGPVETDFLLDVDKNVAKEAQKRMNHFKLRKKVKIDILQTMRVYAAFDHRDLGCPPDPERLTQSAVMGSTFCSNNTQSPGLSTVSTASSQHCHVFPDPRLAALGSRLVLDTSQSCDIKPHVPEDINIVEQDCYHHHRCVLGVAEGVEEVGQGKVTPLEYNLDYLHGVNFHKGCYIGQELTARTHHTGVIRKRILPLRFSTSIQAERDDIDIKNEKGKSVGKAKILNGLVGLGLMRLKETFEAEKLFVYDSDFEVSVKKPEWWPADNK